MQIRSQLFVKPRQRSEGKRILMQSIALIVHVALSIAVIGLVLIQHGKGADAGAAFGSGASSTVFGARGAASFMTRLTTVLAACFFATSIFLFYLAAHRDRGTGSVTDNLPSIEAPAADIPAVNVDGDLPAAVESDSDLPTPAEGDADLPAPADEAAGDGADADVPKVDE